jgi:hypothetical protein
MAKDAAGGGVTITGSNVSTGGGDIVGRDKIEHLSPQIDDVFGPIGKVIETAGGAEKAAAEQKLSALKDEVAKESMPTIR